MKRSVLAEAFKHLIEGYDIPTPAGMLKVKAADAAKELESLPYSVLTNLAHAVLWQDLWLARIHGGKKNSTMEEWRNDWRRPDPSEWESLRRRFIEGLHEAAAIAGAEPFVHKCDSDEEAIDRLLRILVHGAYHCGQMNLLKRALRKTKD